MRNLTITPRGAIQDIPTRMTADSGVFLAEQEHLHLRRRTGYEETYRNGRLGFISGSLDGALSVRGGQGRRRPGPGREGQGGGEGHVLRQHHLCRADPGGFSEADRRQGRVYAALHVQVHRNDPDRARGREAHRRRPSGPDAGTGAAQGKGRPGLLHLPRRLRVPEVGEQRRQDPELRDRIRRPDLQQGAGQTGRCPQEVRGSDGPQMEGEDRHGRPLLPSDDDLVARSGSRKTSSNRTRNG